MLSRFAVEIHTLPVHLGCSLDILHFGGLLRPSFISQRQTEEPPNIRDTSGTSGKRFCTSTRLLRQLRMPQELNSTWKKTIEEPIHMSIAEKSGRPERDSDLRCQSGTVSQKFSNSSVEETLQ